MLTTIKGCGCNAEPTTLQIMLPVAASPSKRKGTVSVRGSEAAEHFLAATNNKHTNNVEPKKNRQSPETEKEMPAGKRERRRERATHGTVVDVQSKPRSRKQSTSKEKRQECPRARAFAIARADSHRMDRQNRSAQAHSRAESKACHGRHVPSSVPTALTQVSTDDFASQNARRHGHQISADPVQAREIMSVDER